MKHLRHIVGATASLALAVALTGAGAYLIALSAPVAALYFFTIASWFILASIV